MKKKMLLATVVFAVGLFTAPVMASEQSTIDYDSMSTEELVALRDEINAKIAERGGDNVIGKGTYEVGVDIRTGNFKVICAANTEYGFTNVELYDSKEQYDNGEDFSDIIQVNYDDEGSTVEQGILNLKEGQLIKVSCGAAVIEEIKGSWMPEN